MISLSDIKFLHKMLENTKTLRVLLLLLVMSYLPVCRVYTEATRVFLEPLSFKKSCGNGMVARQDYFVVKGLVNISNIAGGQSGAVAIYHREMAGWRREMALYLYGTICVDVARIKIDSCTCTSMDSNYVNVKCNVSAKTVHSRSQIFMMYKPWGFSHDSNVVLIPPVYASKSHTERISAVPGIALLGTAVVFLESSIISKM